MNWFLIAILGHLANAAAFIIDKTLLTAAFRRSATYAAMIGTLSFLAALAIPWVKIWPDPSILPYVVAFGGLFVFALWAFFAALSRGEASRVVPVVGALIPLLTFFGLQFIAPESLDREQVIGFVLLIGATIILAGGGSKTGRLDVHTLSLSVIAAFLFATASISGKLAYGKSDFLGVFVSSRLIAGLTGLLIALFDREAWMELRSIFRPTAVVPTQKRAIILTITGQLLGAGGFVLVNIALAAGSASLVNALQAVQYGAIVLVAWFGGKKLRELLQEERTLHVMILKSIGIAAVAVGLYLIAGSALAA